MILHWLNVHFWGPMWPNALTPSAFTIAAVITSHIKQARHRERLHRDMKMHVTKAAGGGG